MQTVIGTASYVIPVYMDTTVWIAPRNALTDVLATVDAMTRLGAFAPFQRPKASGEDQTVETVSLATLTQTAGQSAPVAHVTPATATVSATTVFLVLVPVTVS